MKHTKEVGSIEEESLRKRYDYAPVTSLLIRRILASSCSKRDQHEPREKTLKIREKVNHLLGR